MSFGTCETKKVEIVYISDENYIMPTTVSIQSLLESINPECIYITQELVKTAMLSALAEKC